MTIYFRIEMRIKGRNKIVINKNCSIYIDNEKWFKRRDEIATNKFIELFGSCKKNNIFTSEEINNTEIDNFNKGFFDE